MRFSFTSTMQAMDVLITSSTLFSMRKSRRRSSGQLNKRSSLYSEMLSQTAKVSLCLIVAEKAFKEQEIVLVKLLRKLLQVKRKKSFQKIKQSKSKIRYQIIKNMQMKTGTQEFSSRKIMGGRKYQNLQGLSTTVQFLELHQMNLWLQNQRWQSNSFSFLSSSQ